MGIYKKPAFVNVAAQIEEKLANRNVGVRTQLRTYRRKLFALPGDCVKWIVWNTCKRKYKFQCCFPRWCRVPQTPGTDDILKFANFFKHFSLCKLFITIFAFSRRNAIKWVQTYLVSVQYCSWDIAPGILRKKKSKFAIILEFIETCIFLQTGNDYFVYC